MNLRVPLLAAWFTVIAGLAVPASVRALPQAPDPPADTSENEEEEEEKRPRIHVVGQGGGSGAGANVSFSWNGPGRVDFGIYDVGCINYGEEFNQLVNANRALIGSVAPRAVTWEATLATVRARLADPKLRAGYDAVLQLAKTSKYDPYDPGAANSLLLAQPRSALAQLFAGIEKSPDNVGELFNFAAALNINGMPNEALAVVQRIRALGRKPKLPLEVNGDAALDYLTGYAEMLRGNQAAARTSLAKTIASEPFLNEASHALALLQGVAGNAAQGKATYLAGMWRFKPKYLVACGADGDEDVRPPVDDMFDTSMGVEGKLVKIWHPDKAGDLAPFFEMIGAIAKERNGIAEPLKQRMIAMGNNPKFAGGTGKPYDAWADKLTQLISGLDEIEPYVLKVQDDLEAARRAAQKVASTNQGFVLQRIVELAVKPASSNCAIVCSLVSNGIRVVVSHAQRVEAAYREYARVWFKVATGLNANLGDRDWFEYNDVALRAELESMNAGMVIEIMGYYAFPADAAQQCPEEFVPMFATLGQPPSKGIECKDIFGNLKMKQTVGMPQGLPGPRFTAEVSCDKIKMEVEGDLLGGKAGPLGTSLGGHASAEFERGGGFTLFAGPRVDASAGPLQGSVKTGAFIKGDANGLTDLGGRVEVKGKGGLGPGQAAVKDRMDFGLLPQTKTAPRGPSIPAFRAPPS